MVAWALLRWKRRGKYQDQGVMFELHPQSLTWNPENWWVSNCKLLFQQLIFRCHVKLQGCKCHYSTPNLLTARNPRFFWLGAELSQVWENSLIIGCHVMWPVTCWDIRLHRCLGAFFFLSAINLVTPMQVGREKEVSADNGWFTCWLMGGQSNRLTKVRGQWLIFAFGWRSWNDHFPAPRRVAIIWRFVSTADDFCLVRPCEV